MDRRRPQEPPIRDETHVGNVEQTHVGNVEQTHFMGTTERVTARMLHAVAFLYYLCAETS